MGGSGSAQNQQNNITQTELGLLQQQQANSNQLFQLSYPGMQQAEQYYSSLASGDPTKISNVIGPAVGQINAASQSATQNINQNLPRGGVQQMADANIQQQRVGQIGNLGAQAYTSAFPALASLSQGGIGLAGNEIANAISAGSVASTSNNDVMQNQAAGKGSSLGFLGSLAGVGGQLGAASILSGGGAAAGGAEKSAGDIAATAATDATISL